MAAPELPRRGAVPEGVGAEHRERRGPGGRTAAHAGADAGRRGVIIRHVVVRLLVLGLPILAIVGGIVDDLFAVAVLPSG